MVTQTPDDERLVALRRTQAAILGLAFPDLRRHGAVATPREGALGGGLVSQRVTVEFPEPVSEERVLGAALGILELGDRQITGRTKQDGAHRLDLLGRDGALHSATLLHGGRAVQLTSFSPLEGEAAAATAGEAAPRPDDVRVQALDAEEQLYGPDYGYALLRA